MEKKKPVTKLAVGTRVRMKAGTAVPEFPDVACGGWTGVVNDLIGKSKPAPRYVIEWDEPTLGVMPAEYVARCEADGLFYRMACFSRDELDVVDGE